MEEVLFPPRRAKILRVFFVITIVPFLLLSSCEHDHDHNSENDSEKPVISITKPVAMQSYSSGDTIWINGTVTDNKSLHELNIEIKKEDGTVLFSANPTVHNLTSYNINSYWKSSVSSHANATLNIKAMDHHNNSDTKSVAIHLNP